MNIIRSETFIEFIECIYLIKKFQNSELTMNADLIIMKVGMFVIGYIA